MHVPDCSALHLLLAILLRFPSFLWHAHMAWRQSGTNDGDILFEDWEVALSSVLCEQAHRLLKPLLLKHICAHRH